MLYMLLIFMYRKVFSPMPNKGLRRTSKKEEMEKLENINEMAALNMKQKK